MRMWTRISGIPCQVEFTDLNYNPELWVYDSKGYEAEWLHRKVNSLEEAKLYQEYLQFLQEEAEELKVLRQIDALEAY